MRTGQEPEGASDARPAVEETGHSFLSNLTQGVAGRVLQFVCLFSVGVLIARVFGAEVRGTIAAIMIWPALVCLFFDLGVSRSLPFLIGREAQPIKRVGETAVGLWMCSAAIAMTCVALILFSPLTEALPTLWVVLALAVIGPQMFQGYIRGFSLAVKRPRYHTHHVALTAPTILGTVLILIFLFELNDPEHGWVYILALAIGHSFGLVKALRFMRRYGITRPRIDPATTRMILSTSIWFGLSALAMRIIYQVDIMLLSLPVFDVTRAQLGNYTVAASIAAMMWQFPQAIGVLLLSKGAWADDEQAYARTCAAAARVAILLALVPAALLFAFAPALTALIYGEAFQDAGHVLRILMPGVLMFFGSRILESAMNARGYSRLVLSVMGSAAVLNIALNLALIPAYGFRGAAWASTICYIVGTLVMAIVFAVRMRIGLRDTLLPGALDRQYTLRIFNRLLGRLLRRRPPASGDDASGQS